MNIKFPAFTLSLSLFSPLLFDFVVTMELSSYIDFSLKNFHFFCDTLLVKRKKGGERGRLHATFLIYDLNMRHDDKWC